VRPTEHKESLAAMELGSDGESDVSDEVTVPETYEEKIACMLPTLVIGDLQTLHAKVEAVQADGLSNVRNPLPLNECIELLGSVPQRMLDLIGLGKTRTDLADRKRIKKADVMSMIRRLSKITKECMALYEAQSEEAGSAVDSKEHKKDYGKGISAMLNAEDVPPSQPRLPSSQKNKDTPGKDIEASQTKLPASQK
jgi:hypothetical protein